MDILSACIPIYEVRHRGLIKLYTEAWLSDSGSWPRHIEQIIRHVVQYSFSLATLTIETQENYYIDSYRVAF